MSGENPSTRQHQFDLLFPIAETAADETWIRNNVGSYAVWRLAHTEKITTHTVHRTYWHWQTSAPDHIEPQIYRNIHVTWEPTATGHEKRPWTHYRDGERLSFPYLTSLFVKQAADLDEFAHYTLPYITHVAQNKDVTRFGNVPNELITKSLLLPQNPFLIPDSPLIAGLRSTGPGDTRLANAIADKIGKFLTGNLVHRTAGTVQADPKHEQTLLEMLNVLDEHQLVLPDFWYGYGIRAGLVFRYPQLLEPTVSKLSSPEGMQALQNMKISKPLTVIAGHINNLLAHYAEDKLRDQKRIQDAIKAIHTPLGRTILGRLISIGQGVTFVMNRDLKAKYGADEDVLLSSLDPTQTVQAGEALFRILEAIRLPGLAPEVALQQQEEDSLHTALIETLHLALLKGIIRRNAGDMRLRFDQETNIDELMGQLPPGQFPFQIAAYRRRKKRSADSPVDADPRRLFKPGSGLVS